MDSSASGSSGMVAGSGPIAWMARNPVAANLLMILLLVGGLLMAGRVKQEVFPETELDMVSISVPYPGASPAEVEQGIVLAVEEAVRGIDGVKRVVATASEGSARINAELTIDADDEKVLADVKSAVDRITSLPKDAERPVVSLVTNRSEVISMVVYGEQDLRVLRRIAEQARDLYLSDSRITQADLAGAPKKEISIEVPREQLRVHNLTLEQIAAKVSQTSLQLPGGGVKTATGEVLVRTDERREDERGFSEIPVVTGPAGTEVRLGDIARVRETFAETDESASFAGMSAVMIRVYRIGSQKPLEVAGAVRELTAKFEARMPEGVKIAQWQDMSEIYAARMDLLMRNAQSGLILVVLCLSLFLEIRVALWVAWGIPTSFLGALFLMPLFGVSVNMISLFAFIVVLGMVVDDAIVIGENIFERAQRGESYIQAAVNGTREVGIPVVFSVLTTVAAFTPLFFLPGFMGKFMSVIPVIVIAVLLFSLVESLFILPAHLGHLSKPEGGIYGAVFKFQQRFVVGLDRFIENVYAPIARAALRFRYLTLTLGFATLVLTLTYVAAGLIGFRFMPGIEGDVVTAAIELPYGSSVEQTRRVQDRMVRAAQELVKEYGGDPVLRGVFAQVGSRGPVMGPVGGTNGSGGHVANVRVFFVPSDLRDFKTGDFAAEWRKRVGPVPEAKTINFSANMGPSAGKPVDVELSHADEDVLEQAAAEVAGTLRGYGGVFDVENGVALGKPQLDLTLTPEARTLGLTSTDIARQVRGAFFGAEALRQQDGRDEVRVIARLPFEERRSEHDIEELLIRTPQGGEVPLHEAAVIERGRSWPSIERADGKRIVHVTAELREGEATPGMVNGKLRTELLDGLPEKYPGLSWQMGGENREQAESFGSLKTGALMALLAIYALLAIPFRSYVQPLIVMAAIPFGLVGAIGGHILLGYELSMMSMMGMVALSGVVVNDSLVLIDATNEFRRTRALGHFEAVIAAGVRRFRPILLTSVTTFFGLMPMILEPSVQARFLIPMAISLGFGVMFATAITLILVPALYLAVEDLRRGLGAWWDLVKGKQAPPPPRSPTESLERFPIDV
ncbi:efflux RND transporter permease subunit [Nannocystis sp. SCPEA4]|uniref:efflux RND transporter permease subunit n=1 Tax=Nannocystis sp. SCPEA4 TaxID=2996787 RepID=UPI00226E9CC8|nr:efflux RND transporter permease subunit [Nannocystis sp. SCPEA4]MCY1054505.1 efflux RND transporter permease subunit [Nannocystis sp. SCPEA4]